MFENVSIRPGLFRPGNFQWRRWPSWRHDKRTTFPMHNSSPFCKGQNKETEFECAVFGEATYEGRLSCWGGRGSHSKITLWNKKRYVSRNPHSEHFFAEFDVWATPCKGTCNCKVLQWWSIQSSNENLKHWVFSLSPIQVPVACLQWSAKLGIVACRPGQPDKR